MLSVTVAPWFEQICMTVYYLFDPQTAALENEQRICMGQNILGCIIPVMSDSKMTNLQIKPVKIMPHKISLRDSSSALN